MKTSRWSIVAPMLGPGLLLGLTLLLLTLPQAGLAQTSQANQSVGLSLGPAPKAGAWLIPHTVTSIANSSVTTGHCYEANQTQTLCFTVFNASTDAEWLNQVRLTFPPGPPVWTVNCSTQDATDSSGNPASLTCSEPLTNEVLFTDNDNASDGGLGEIMSGTGWGFCVNATVPVTYSGPRIINWGLSGDATSAIEGETLIEQCAPLMLKPASLTVEGCNGITQTHSFELWNNTGSGGSFDFVYDVPSGNATFAGPENFALVAGGTVTFNVQLTPDACLEPGQQVTATLQVAGNGEFDTSTIANSVCSLAGWQARTASPASTMDNVVVWAAHADGGLWSIGGYGSNGAAQRYDPATNTWSTHTPETVISPTIEYPVDGCYGLDAAGDEVVVLFPDTIVTGSLHIYNITQNNWYTEPVPAFYPLEGRWAQDVVSLLNNPSVKAGVEKNACYLSGGSDQPGGGRMRDLWVYYPDGAPGGYLGQFFLAPNPEAWFNFHASWYVPWVGQDGAICVGGGVDHNHQFNTATQCYDLSAGSFNAANADLGPLPEPWWGMADGWQIQRGQYQIWIANGVAQDGRLIQKSAYADQSSGGFVYGPEPPVALYRLEGDGWEGQFYAEQGAAGGFNHTVHNQLLAQCPFCAHYFVYLPLVQR